MEVQQQKKNVLQNELQSHPCCSPESVFCFADIEGSWQDGPLSTLLKVYCYSQPGASSTAWDAIFRGGYLLLCFH